MPSSRQQPGIDESALRSVRDVRIETPRLILREHTESDADAVYAYTSDPEVARFTTGTPLGRDRVASNLARVAEHRLEEPVRRRYELAIVRRDEDALIGWIPLNLSPEPDRIDAEIGWTLARAYWGQGYATEAALALLAFGFERLNLHRIWARCQSQNSGSMRVMEKLGMRREAYFRRSQLVGHTWVDIVHYALLEEEWWERKRAALVATDSSAGTADGDDIG